MRYVLGEIEALDKDIRKRIAHSSPYFDSNVNDRVQKVYEILTTIRLINNKEIEGNEADVVTNLFWLNEELYFLNDDLEKVMKGYQVKKEGTVTNWITVISVLINIILAVYIYFNH